MGALDGIWSGVASGVGGIVSSIFGNKAQRDANRANFELAQMNNQWSEKMMDKQAAYNLAQCVACNLPYILIDGEYSL